MRRRFTPRSGISITSAIIAVSLLHISAVHADENGERLDRALQKIEQGRFHDALDLLHAIQLDKPESKALAHHLRATALGQLERRTEALEQLDAALSISPGYIAARQDRGVVLCELGRFVEARRDFVEVLRGDPDNLKCRLNMLLCLVELDQRDQAIDAAQAALEAAQKHEDTGAIASVSQVLAKLLVARGSRQLEAEIEDASHREERLRRLEKSESDYRKALAVDDEWPEVWIGIGTIRALREDQQGARAAFAEAVRRSPGSDAAWLRLARGFALIGDRDSAVNAVDRVFELSGGEGNAMLIFYCVRSLARVEAFEEAREAVARLRARRDTTLLAELAEGELLSAETDYAGAIDRFTAALALDSRNPVGLEGRKDARMALGKFDEALADVDRLLLFSPDSVVMRLERCEVLHALGRTDELLRECGVILALEPKCVEALDWRWKARCAGGDLDGALADLQACFELAPSACESLHEARKTLLEERLWRSIAGQHWKRAELDALACIEHDPADVSLWIMRATAVAATGDARRALAILNQANWIAPRNPQPRLARGMLLRNLDKLDGALDDLNHVVQAHPENVNGWVQRGILHLKRKAPAEALADFQRAFELVPESPFVARQIEFCLRQTQRPDEAERWRETAARLEMSWHKSDLDQVDFTEGQPRGLARWARRSDEGRR